MDPMMILLRLEAYPILLKKKKQRENNERDVPFYEERKNILAVASFGWLKAFHYIVSVFRKCSSTWIWPNYKNSPRFPCEIKGPISLVKSATKIWGLLTDFGFVFGRDSNWSQPSDGFTSLESFGFASYKRQASQDRRWRVKIAPCRRFFLSENPTVGG